MMAVPSPTRGSRAKTRSTPYVDVAVVGLGAIGAAHVDAALRAPSTRLAAVADVDAARAREIAAKAGCPAFDSLPSLLEGADVDLVVVATPDALHVEVVQQAAAAGMHVLLEKPLATTVEDGRTILAAVREAGVLFTVGHCLRFDPKYVELERRVSAGELGELATVYARRQNQVGAVDRLKGRVSSLLFLAVHDIDIINWYVKSRPVSVYCASAAKIMRGKGYAVDDVSFTTIRYENGAVGVVESGWLLPPNYPRTGHFELVATGSRGVARLDEFDEGLWVANETFKHIPLVDRLTPQLQHMAEAIIHGREPLVSGEDGYSAMEIALAAEVSAREGRVVELPLAPA